MANGANRLFNVMKKTSEDTNTVPSQIVSLTVKSIQPLIFTRDDRLEITKDFCVFSKGLNANSFNIGDIVTAMVFNNGQKYYIEQNNSSEDTPLNYNDLDNKPTINGVELSGNKSAADLSLISTDDITFDEQTNLITNKKTDRTLLEDTQNVLASPGLYMTANHTVNLSQRVSKQNNGIVLVWSAYINGAPGNYNWNFTFVPKQWVSLHEGSGVTCQMSGSTFSSVACKYIYIYDDRLVGNASNNASGSASGITYKNDDYVLRYVIGV